MKSEDLIKVWDLPLRIFHWLLVIAFFIAYFTEDELLTVHVWAGYLVGGLLVFRLLGHNPAGAAMIVLLLLSLLMTVITGLAVYGADQAAGPLAFIGNSHEDFWEEIHEFFANFTLLLVIVHVIGVVVESIIHRENLAKAMFNGNKKRP
ncbi:MAG: cytochrome b/b6 domain-containing protein [Methylococcaceae bacterium]|nr:cytochrome b/b6 domain-containing protein [Methylococcaceae bacterium]